MKTIYRPSFSSGAGSRTGKNEMPRSQKGFTLIEMIISVGLLALAGLAVITLFVSAHVKNEKASDLDQSVAQCTWIIESLKSIPDINEKLEVNKEIIDSIFVLNKMDDGYHCIASYNKEWELLLPEDALTQSNISDKTPQYQINIEISPYSKDSPGLYSVNLRVTKVHPYPLERNEHAELFTVSAIVGQAPQKEVSP